MDERKATIASNLIKLRLAAGMTQAELGEKLNYSDKSISKWERGDVTTDVFVLMQIAEIFGVDVDYLLKPHNEIEPVIYGKPDRSTYTTDMITLVAILGICPLLNMDEQGHLIPRAKIRSKKKVIQEMLTRMEQYADNGLDYDGKCFISQSECYEDARALADLIEAKFPKLNGKVDINYVGTTIGSHTGPGTVALFFWGRDRKLPLL